MSTLQDTGIHGNICLYFVFLLIILISLPPLLLTFCNFFFSGLVVPDVPLEETEILRKEAISNNIELV